MKIHINLFHKIILLIIIVISVILFLYGRSHQSNIKLITSQLVATNLDHLHFFAQQVDTNVDQLFTNAHTLFRDTEIKDYSEIENLAHLIDKNNTKLNVLNKLSLQTSSTNFIHHISIYNLLTEEVLSTDTHVQYDKSLFTTSLPNEWTYIKNDGQFQSSTFFHLFLSQSTELLQTPNQANIVMEIQVSASELIKMLSQYQTPSSGDIFFYNPEHGILSSADVDSILALNLVNKIQNLTEHDSISTTINFEKKRYIVNTAWSSSLNWHVIHISPLEEFLKPLESSRLGFTSSIIILLVLSIIIVFILYKQIHRPIYLLLKAVNHIKEGNLGYRIQLRTKNEFWALNEAFNSMAAQIQQLIERVYLEQLRVKDSYLKQLQSQINPHFLYNCLFFIKSKATVQDYESISKMAINLGEYYRYITRLDHSFTTIEQEIKLLQNYLAVQNLRKQRIEYDITIPKSLMNIQIPRLLIQPLVENCIVHGVEKIAGIGIINISGREEGTRLFITVEDNGPGMDEVLRKQLVEHINSPNFESASGYGLWNVQQRIKQLYGVHSGLTIEKSSLGGVMMTIRLDRNEG